MNEAQYMKIAQWLRHKYTPVRGFDGNFPTWLIREEIGARSINKTVKGVYEQLAKLVEPAPSEVGDRSEACGALRSEQWPSGQGSRDWQWAHTTDGHCYGGS